MEGQIFQVSIIVILMGDSNTNCCIHVLVYSAHKFVHTCQCIANREDCVLKTHLSLFLCLLHAYKLIHTHIHTHTNIYTHTHTLPTDLYNADI